MDFNRSWLERVTDVVIPITLVRLNLAQFPFALVVFSRWRVLGCSSLVGSDRKTVLRGVNIEALIAEANKFPTWVKPAGGMFSQPDDIRGFILAGTPADVARETRAYEDAGADHIVYDLRFRFADWLDQIDLLGKEVLPALRG